MRRIAAIVVPDLAIELAERRFAPGTAPRPEGKPRHGGPTPTPRARPLAVVLTPPGVPVDTDEATRPTDLLDAVNAAARRLGVRPGQRVAEAAALASDLLVVRVPLAELHEALGRLAEVALAFGTTPAVRLVRDEGVAAGPPLGGTGAIVPPTCGDDPFDTVWLDVTGIVHLWGGEAAWRAEVVERFAEVGHAVVVAVAAGPRLARALARHGLAEGEAGDERARVARLPVAALPIGFDLQAWFLRLGVVTCGDLARLPPAQLGARLGALAPRVLDLVQGKDPAPLVAHEPPPLVVESLAFDEGVFDVEALLFVVRGMAARAAHRLQARGQAATGLELVVAYDRAIARLAAQGMALWVEPGDDEALAPADRPLRARPTGDADVAPVLRLRIDLPAPLAREADLVRALRAKLERVELLAPALALTLTLDAIVAAPEVQLDLARGVAVDPAALPTLLAELAAELGPDRIGVLEVVDAHRPEARSRLVPVPREGGRGRARRPARGARVAVAPVTPAPAVPTEADVEPLVQPTRLVASLPLGHGVGRGSTVVLGRQLFSVAALLFVMRLDRVEWWVDGEGTSRDYLRAWLVTSAPAPAPAFESGGRPRGSADALAPRTTSVGAEAWLYVDRRSGETYFQGWCE